MGLCALVTLTLVTLAGIYFADAQLFAQTPALQPNVRSIRPFAVYSQNPSQLNRYRQPVFLARTKRGPRLLRIPVFKKVVKKQAVPYTIKSTSPVLGLQQHVQPQQVQQQNNVAQLINRVPISVASPVEYYGQQQLSPATVQTTTALKQTVAGQPLQLQIFQQPEQQVYQQLQQISKSPAGVGSAQVQFNAGTLLNSQAGTSSGGPSFITQYTVQQKPSEGAQTYSYKTMYHG